MNRPLLRARLRWRLNREVNDWYAHYGTKAESDAYETVMGSDAIADRVLDRLSAEHGSGGLLDLLLKIDWVKLLEIIMAVVSMLGAMEDEDSDEKERPIDQLRQAESD